VWRSPEWLILQSDVVVRHSGVFDKDELGCFGIQKFLTKMSLDVSTSKSWSEVCARIIYLIGLLDIYR
jgi:hypothetical protein